MAVGGESKPLAVASTNSSLELSPRTVRRRAVGIASVALFGAAVVFVLGACTRWGQTFGDSAYAGRLLSAPELRNGALDVLDSIRARSVAAFGTAILVAALMRKRVRLAIVVSLVMAVSMLGAEVLKRSLPRPDYGIDPPGMTANWAPSGHSTVAITLVLCALMVAPQRSRRALSVLGSVYAALIASGTLAAGWHRPTDAVMAAFWSFAIATFGVAILVAWRGVGDNDGGRAAEEHHRVHRTVLTVAILLPVAVLWSSFMTAPDRIVWTQSSGRFVLALVVIAVVAAGSVMLFARMLRGLSLDAP